MNNEKLKRINPTVTDEAYAIYEALPLKDKKHFVSEAIIEKAGKKQLEARVRNLESKVEKLEGNK